MFTNELEAKTVQRANVRGVEKRELFVEVSIVRQSGGFFFERGAEPPAHFRRGGFRERDDENFINRRAFADDAIQATFAECMRFTRAGAGHDEDVAARG